jgi:hypothetical protein
MRLVGILLALGGLGGIVYFSRLTGRHWPIQRAKKYLETLSSKMTGMTQFNIRRGDNRREIIDHIDELRFRSQNEKHAVAPV